MSTKNGYVISQMGMWLNIWGWLNCGDVARKDMEDDFRKGKRKISIDLQAY